MKLTPWFKKGTKPAYIGVYEADEEGYFQNWNGLFWGYYARDIAAAGMPHNATQKSTVQHPKWRGLAEKP